MEFIKLLENIDTGIPLKDFFKKIKIKKVGNLKSTQCLPMEAGDLACIPQEREKYVVKTRAMERSKSVTFDIGLGSDDLDLKRSFSTDQVILRRPNNLVMSRFRHIGFTLKCFCCFVTYVFYMVI